MAACYRHPGRETNVQCSNCGRPICPDCMTVTPVGMRCPECARERTQVRRVGSGLHAGALLLTPDAHTVGASGAVFGLMSAAFIVARHRGVEQLAGQIGVYILINIV